MRKLLFLIPVAAAGLLLTGCDEASYRERTVAYDRGPAYYGGGDTDFYYVSSRPYSRSYGQLYLRDGRYYYSRGGRYVIYDRPTYAYDRVAYRHGYDRRDYDHDRRDHRDHDRYRSSDRSNELRQEIEERNLERVRNQQKIQEYRERQVYNANQQKLEYRQARQEARNEQLKNQWQSQRGQAQRTQRARAQQAVYRQPQAVEGQKKRKKEQRED